MASTEPSGAPSPAAASETHRCSRCGRGVEGVARALDPKLDPLEADGEHVRARGCARCETLYCRPCLKHSVAWNLQRGHRDSACPKCGQRFGDGLAVLDPARAAALPAPAPQGLVVHAARRPASRVLFPLAMALVALAVAALALGPWQFFGGGSNRLTVDSDPPGASLFVNGRLIGATPIALSDLKPGSYVLRLERVGFKEDVRHVEIGDQDAVVSASLAKLPTGGLNVAIEPEGSEVLLDGDMIGNTPLVLTSVPAGPHELVVRKTNFETYTQRITIKPNEVAEFEGFELRDLILAMLKRQCLAEPQRISHRMDLGHYLFVNDHLDDAADAYGEALELSATPPTFPEEMPPEERALQQRLHSEDCSRLTSELGKKKQWPGKDTTAFKEKLDKIQAELAEKHVESWAYVKLAAKNMIRGGQYAEAERLYLRHLEAQPNGEQRGEVWVELLTLRQRARNFNGMLECSEQLMADAKPNSEFLRQAAGVLHQTRSGFPAEGAAKAQTQAVRMLRKAVSVAQAGEPQALAAFDLANVLYGDKEYPEALTLYQKAVEQTAEASVKETRQLKEAACLARLKRFKEARESYERLTKSSQESVRKAAEKGLQTLEVYERKDK
ncbi:MAG: PEGA domain-containing protein [Planctomycetota bacterium]|nr:PEGA domain-containing protein [Planctomycetota bacterium]